MQLSSLLAIARGDHEADLLLRNGRIVNVFSGTIEEADIAVAAGRIVGIGHGYHAARTVDLGKRYVAPGFIDAHVHIESSLCTPPQFAAAVLPRGVTTVVTDPHEIANVAGSDQFWVVDASLGYQFKNRLGSLSLTAKNLFDEDFRFQDTDPANPSIQPERLLLLKLNLLF